MVRRVVSGLVCLLLATFDPSIGAAFASASPRAAQRSPLDLAVEAATPDDEEPNPSDPQCGACAAYVLKDQMLYAVLPSAISTATVRLELHSQDSGLLGVYELKPTVIYGGGQYAYRVPGGPTGAEVHWGVLTWKSKSGFIIQTEATIQPTWGGFRSLTAQ